MSATICCTRCGGSHHVDVCDQQASKFPPLDVDQMPPLFPSLETELRQRIAALEEELRQTERKWMDIANKNETERNEAWEACQLELRRAEQAERERDEERARLASAVLEVAAKWEYGQVQALQCRLRAAMDEARKATAK